MAAFNKIGYEDQMGDDWVDANVALDFLTNTLTAKYVADKIYKGGTSFVEGDYVYYRGYNDNLGWTNYYAGLQAAENEFRDDPSSSILRGKNAKNVAYFLTDGDPTNHDGIQYEDINGNIQTPSENNIDGAREEVWEKFLTDHDINAFGVAFGDKADKFLPAVKPIAFDGTAVDENGDSTYDEATDPNAIDGKSDLAGKLLTTVQEPSVGELFNTTGNLLTKNTGFGADEASQVVTITFDNVTYTYDKVANKITNDGGLPTVYNSEMLEVTSGTGSKLSLNMLTADYEYSPSALIPNGGKVSETLGYKLEDQDGDNAEGTLTFNIRREKANINAVDDNYETAFDTPVQINPKAGDSDADNDPLTVTKINGIIVEPNAQIPVPDGTVTVGTDGTTFTFTPDAGFKGKSQFSYEITDNNGNTEQALETVTVKPPFAKPSIEIVTDVDDNGIITTDDNQNVTNPELSGNLIKVKVTVDDVNKLKVGDTITIAGPMGSTPEVITIDDDAKLTEIKTQLNNGGLTREFLRPVGTEEVDVKVTIADTVQQASATDDALLAQPFDVLTHVELRTKVVSSAGGNVTQIINPETGVSEGTMNDTNPDNDYRIAQGQLPKENMQSNGRHIAKVVHNGTDYTADGSGIITVPNTSEGGVLIINSKTGEYTYKLANTEFASVNNGDQDSFKIITADKDANTRELESDFKVQIDQSQAYDRTVTKDNIGKSNGATENPYGFTIESSSGGSVKGRTYGEYGSGEGFGIVRQINGKDDPNDSYEIDNGKDHNSPESLMVTFDYLVAEAEVKIAWLQGRDPSTGEPNGKFLEQVHIYFLDVNGNRIIDPKSETGEAYRYTQNGGTNNVDTLGEIRLPTGKLFRGLEFTVPKDESSDYLINMIRVIKAYDLDGIDGGSDSEYIYGDASDDKINGFAGHDNIIALAGDDYIDAGTGNDIIKAGEGNDIVRAGDGDDYVEAGAGNDLIDGGAGNDNIKAGAGNDVIIYDNADSKVDGGLGLDTLYLNNNETIDFANLANNVDSIETIEANDSVVFTLNNIKAQDVLDISDNDTLFIQGNADDKVSVVGWNANGTHTEGTGVKATLYNVYTDNGATLYIEDGIQTTL